MDLQMPEMDGIAATKIILADFTTHNGFVPSIVAVTANTFESDREDCVNAGMVDFIPKPIAIEALEKCLTGLALKATQAPQSGIIVADWTLSEETQL